MSMNMITRNIIIDIINVVRTEDFIFQNIYFIISYIQ
jgi:hypothetical protein